jgi:hypothetical protein
MSINSPLVGAGRGPSGYDFVSFCDLIVDRDPDVGESMWI